jgi:hypothetical protein
MAINKFGNMLYIITIVTSFGLLLSFSYVNSAFSKAVPLVKVHTGSSAVDSSIPHFFSCIHHAVHSNEGKSGISSYFKHEPTKNEVISCFHKNVKH